MDHGRRADLLGAGQELRVQRAVPDPRPLDRRVRRHLPGADLACVGRLQDDPGRLRGGEGDQLRDDVARRDPGIPAGAADALDVVGARRGGSHRRPALDGLHGHADDRERLLPDLPLRGAGGRGLDRAAEHDDDALGGRADRARLPDPRAGALLRAGDPDRAAPLRMGPAPRLAGAEGLPADVRPRRRRRPARDHRPGRARLVAARDPRRVPGRGRDALPLLAGRRVVLVPARRPRPLARGRAARGADRPLRRLARAGQAGAGVPRRLDRRHVLADARGLGVRLRSPAARRGAEHVLRRAALPDRLARLDRPRHAAARAARRPRRARRRRAPGRAPVPAPDHDERGLRHADAAPDLVAADVAVPDRADGARRRARVHVRRRAVGARAPPLRADPPGADPRLLRGLAEADRGEAQDGVGRRALRRDHAAARLGRPGGRARPGGGDDLVGAGEPVRDLGERDLQPQRAALLLPALAARRRPPRAEGEGRSGVGRDAGRREARRRPLRARRQLGPARRQIAPPGPADRHDAVRDRRAAAAGLAGDRPLPERHVVRALRLVHAPRVPRRAAEGRPPERPGALHEAADGDRADRREGGGARADPGRRCGEPGRPAPARQPRLQRRLRGHADRGAGGRHQGVQSGRPRARRALLDVRVQAAAK